MTLRKSSKRQLCLQVSSAAVVPGVTGSLGPGCAPNPAITQCSQDPTLNVLLPTLPAAPTYLINNEADFWNISKTSMKNQYYLMTSDVVLNVPFSPTDLMGGLDHVVFDGGGHTLTVRGTSPGCALMAGVIAVFSQLTYSNLKNLKLKPIEADGLGPCCNVAFIDKFGGSCIQNVQKMKDSVGFWNLLWFDTCNYPPTVLQNSIQPNSGAHPSFHTCMSCGISGC